jgi:serine/threonine-protein kinase
VESTPTDSLRGQTIDGRYRIDGRLARGGMATVYRATDLRLDRPVAVKILHPHLADGTKFVDRFRREARAAARLIDPGIVGVHDQGTWGDTPYLVMELVEGPNLRALMVTSGLPKVGKALDLMIQVLQALAVAHAAGFVHRDIKPENILVTKSGRIKVADFGLARAVSEVTAASSGVVLGTVAYLSPELVAEGIADKRTDVYAAGVVLFELLTGTQPYIADAPIQVAFQHVHADFPAPSSRIDWMPPEIDTLVRAMTAKAPEDRPADAAAALAMIRTVRRSLPDTVTERVPESAVAPPPLPGDLPLIPDAAPSGAVVTSPEDVAGLDAQVNPPHHAVFPPPGGARAARAARGGLSGGFGGVPRATGPDDLDTAPSPLLVGSSGGTQALPLAQIMAAGPPPDPAASISLIPSSTSVLPAPVPVEPPAARPQAEKPANWWWWIAAGVLLISVGASSGLSWYFKNGPGSQVTVPTLQGLDQAAAEEALRALDLKPKVKLTFDDVVPKGIVISATPDEGDLLDPGTEVELAVSGGVRTATVPTAGILGEPASLARNRLKEATLDGEVIEESVYNTQVPEGLVVAVDPPGGTATEHSKAIKLTVSKGPEPVEIPRVTGQSATQAETALAELELEMVRNEQYSEDVAKGRVISQSPSGGTQGHRGDRVTVEVSLGPPLVMVPDLFSLGFAKADAQLRSVGLEIMRQESFRCGWVPSVQRQEPAAGSMVPKGSIVTVYCD